MAAPKLTDEAVETSNITIIATFKDEDKTIIDVSDLGSITWSLTDLDNNVVNSRENIAITTANPLTLTLEGNDLIIMAGENSSPVDRAVTFITTYDSSYGSNIPLKEEVRFKLRNRVR
ncbi:hypothetical protein LCGC14_1447050 [marine sediment metagenome]|uniref:BppU N-terminal domain-containing protein n=1 Tax=marine sediment metagenome TaxID=412755 RepID=A0A0F9MKV7_9ZZZZ